MLVALAQAFPDTGHPAKAESQATNNNTLGEGYILTRFKSVS